MRLEDGRGRLWSAHGSRRESQYNVQCAGSFKRKTVSQERGDAALGTEPLRQGTRPPSSLDNVRLVTRHIPEVGAAGCRLVRSAHRRVKAPGVPSGDTASFCSRNA